MVNYYHWRCISIVLEVFLYKYEYITLVAFHECMCLKMFAFSHLGRIGIVGNGP